MFVALSEQNMQKLNEATYVLVHFPRIFFLAKPSSIAANIVLEVL